MATADAVQTFLSSSPIAVVGVSRNPKKFGTVIYRELKQRGRKVVPVHPERPVIEGDPSFASVSDLPGEVRAVITVVPPAVTEKVVDECIAHGVRGLWMQQGSSSATAIRKAEEAGMTVVHGQCILMFLEPVRSVHAFHRFIWKLFGRYPR